MLWATVLVATSTPKMRQSVSRRAPHRGIPLLEQEDMPRRVLEYTAVNSRNQAGAEEHAVHCCCTLL